MLQADAWGHGAAVTHAILTEAGLHPDDDGAVDPLALFGLPGAVFGLTGAVQSLSPVMSLTGTVLAVKELRRGEGVSYGYLHRASEDTRIALITGGYAQGIVRALGGAVAVGDGEHSFAVIGRVAMDVCVVDIGTADVGRGATLTFFGDPSRGEPPLEPWVTHSAMTAGEIVSAVGARAVRRDAA